MAQWAGVWLYNAIAAPLPTYYTMMQSQFVVFWDFNEIVKDTRPDESSEPEADGMSNGPNVIRARRDRQSKDHGNIVNFRKSGWLNVVEPQS